MKYRLLYLLISILVISGLNAQQQEYPADMNRLLKAYPTTIKAHDKTSIILNGDKIIQYNTPKDKSHKELINSDALEDIFAYPYLKGEVKDIPQNYDPGRTRSETLLKSMYGATSAEVQKHLVTITWCPNLINQKLRVTSINGVDKQLQRVSDELDKHPELKEYLHSAGTFNWRKVRGADRLSAHSFGTAIDLNVKYSNYWQWDCRCTNEDATLKYKNRIPQLIVDIFEKHGFIWGGKWYHYDTMHFEYRPELLVD